MTRIGCIPGIWSEEWATYPRAAIVGTGAVRSRFRTGNGAGAEFSVHCVRWSFSEA